MNDQRLIQFQCQKEGTLFYYQSSKIGLPFDWKCPLCGSKRIEQTGREFDPVDENSPIQESRAALQGQKGGAGR